MSATRLSLLTAACASLLAPASACWAQAYGAAHVVEHNDLNWFEPVELDLDGRIEAEEGFFFHFDKLYWAATGERQTLGHEGLAVTSETIFRDNSPVIVQFQVDGLIRQGLSAEEIAAILNVTYLPGQFRPIPIFDDEGNQIGTLQSPVIDNASVDQTPASYQVQNGIQDASPDAEFAWGERYEFGYSDGERGWIVGILDGPEVESSRAWGAGNTPYDSQTDGNGPGPDPEHEDDDIDGNGDGVLDGDGDTRELHSFGFGSVPVNFNLPNADFLTGFRDYLNNIGGPAAGTVYGPVYYVGNYGSVGEDDTEDTIDAARADNLDGDNIDGSAFVFIDLDGDGEVGDDEVIGQITDFDDLHQFNVFFNTVFTRARTEVQGVELMATHNLSQSHRLEQGRRDQLQLSYGVRFMNLSDYWAFQGLGSIIGRTSVVAELDNQLIGPQIGLAYTRDNGPWDLTVGGRFMFAYNRTDIDQVGIWGEEAIPGALNRSAVARTTATGYGAIQDDFSPLGELRVDARYKFSKAVALTIGYTAQYIDNIQRASKTVQWNAPDWGIKDGKSDILMNGLNFGVELRY
ncbi:MAG: BBP7 family outer membrane beta-barrel protein [Lacipirellulaceae bacterium]